MAEAEKTEIEQIKKKGLSTPVLISVIAGGVLLLFAAIILIFSIMMNNMKETLLSGSDKKPEKKELSKKKKVETLDKFEYLETGRITTNPSGSSQFVVVNLGIFYGPDKSKKSSEDADEHEADPTVKMKRLNALIRHQINSQIGDKDIYALQIPRDSLMAIFKNKLKPSFKMEGLMLKDVILIEFIIQ